MQVEAKRFESLKLPELRTFFVRVLTAFILFTHSANANQSALQASPAPSSEPCPSEDYLFHESAKAAYLNSAPKTPEKPYRILFKEKLPITDTDSNIRLAERILGTPEPSDWLQKAAECKNAFCIIRSLVDSDETAYRLFTIPRISSVVFTLSPREAGMEYITRKKASSIWKKEELRQFNTAIEHLPSFLRYFPREVRAFRTGVRDLEYSAKSFPTMDIQIFNDTFLKGDLPFDGSERTTFSQKVLIHELCHIYDMNSETMKITTENDAFFRDPQLPAALNFAAQTRSYRTEYVSETSDQYEDFAETCAYFVANPKTLKARAPHKYTVIQNMLFMGADYSHSPWNKPLYTSLDSFLNSPEEEAACEKDFAEYILRSVQIETSGRITEFIPAGLPYGSRPASPVAETLTFENWPQGSLALKPIQENRLLEFLPTAKKDPEFCMKGGEVALKNRFRSACKNTLRRVTELAHYSYADTFPSSVSQCATKHDYSKKCLTDLQAQKLLKNLGDNPLSQAFIAKTESSIFPASVRAQVMETIRPEQWLPACLSEIKNVKLEGRLLKYHLKSDLASSRSDPDGMNTELSASHLEADGFIPAQGSFTAPKTGARCFSEIHKLLVQQGISFGNDLSDAEIASILNESDTYKKTIQSFENSVILPLIYEVRADPGYEPGTIRLSRVSHARGYVRQWARSNPSYKNMPLKAILEQIPQYIFRK